MTFRVKRPTWFFSGNGLYPSPSGGGQNDHNGTPVGVSGGLPDGPYRVGSESSSSSEPK